MKEPEINVSRGQANAPQFGQPIILYVNNICNHNLKDVELFDALNRAWDIPFVMDGRYQTDELIITSGIPSFNCSYKNIIRSIAIGDVFTFGKIYITGFDVEKRGFDLEQKKGVIKLEIQTYSLNGNNAAKLIELTYMPDQVEPKVMVKESAFDLDKHTSVKIDHVLKGEQLQIAFYVASTINLPKIFFPPTE